MKSLSCLILISLVSVLIIGCSEQHNLITTKIETINLPSVSALELPTASRQSSVIHSKVGAKYLDPFKSAYAEPESTEMLLKATGKSAQWAVYQLNFQLADPPKSVTIELASTATIWIAIADYSLQTWSWVYGKQEGKSQYILDLGVIKTFLSPKNNLHIAVVADQTDVVVKKVFGSTDAVGAWSMYGNNRRHTSQSKYRGPSKPAIIWQTPMDESWSSPVMDIEGNIYAFTNTSKLYSLNSMDGSINWTFIAAKTSFTAPAVDSIRKQVYIADQSGIFYAINTETGKEKWRYTHIGQVSASLLIADDGTILYNQGNGLWALNPDGTLKWKKDEDSKWKTGAGVGDDGTIYYGTWNDTYVYAVNPDGSEKWKTKVGGELRGVPTINAGYVYIPSTDKNLNVLKASDGTLVNASTLGSTGFGGAASINLDNGVLVPSYNGTNAGYIYGYNPDGTVVSTGDVPGSPVPTLVIGNDGTLYLPVQGSINALIAIDKETKSAKWSIKFTSVQSSMIIGPGNVIYLHTNLGLTAIGEKVD